MPSAPSCVGLGLHPGHGELAGVVHRLRQPVQLLVLAPAAHLEARRGRCSTRAPARAGRNPASRTSRNSLTDRSEVNSWVPSPGRIRRSRFSASAGGGPGPGRATRRRVGRRLRHRRLLVAGAVGGVSGSTVRVRRRGGPAGCGVRHGADEQGLRHHVLGVPGAGPFEGPERVRGDDDLAAGRGGRRPRGRATRRASARAAPSSSVRPSTSWLVHVDALLAQLPVLVLEGERVAERDPGRPEPRGRRRGDVLARQGRRPRGGAGAPGERRVDVPDGGAERRVLLDARRPAGSPTG